MEESSSAGAAIGTGERGKPKNDDPEEAEGDGAGLVLDWRGGFRAMMVLLLKQMHLQKDVAVSRASRAGRRRERKMTKLVQKEVSERILRTIQLLLLVW